MFRSKQKKRKKSKSSKAQAAMEFLLSYGWSMVILITVIATLSYFYMHLNRQFPDMCFISPGVYCSDAQFISETSIIKMTIKNNLGGQIDDLVVTLPGCYPYAYKSYPYSGSTAIMPGETITADVNCRWSITGSGKINTAPEVSYRFRDTDIFHTETGILRISNGSSKSTAKFREYTNIWQCPHGYWYKPLSCKRASEIIEGTCVYGNATPYDEWERPYCPQGCDGEGHCKRLNCTTVEDCYVNKTDIYSCIYAYCVNGLCDFNYQGGYEEELCPPDLPYCNWYGQCNICFIHPVGAKDGFCQQKYNDTCHVGRCYFNSTLNNYTCYPAPRYECGGDEGCCSYNCRDGDYSAYCQNCDPDCPACTTYSDNVACKEHHCVWQAGSCMDCVTNSDCNGKGKDICHPSSTCINNKCEFTEVPDCILCSDASICPDRTCYSKTCNEKCIYSPIPAGTIDPFCPAGVPYCDSNGDCVNCTSDLHCNVLIACQEGKCTGNLCTIVDKQIGSEDLMNCPAGKTYCDGTGNCVECTDSSQCSASVCKQADCQANQCIETDRPAGFADPGCPPATPYCDGAGNCQP